MYEDIPTAYVNIVRGSSYAEQWTLTDEAGDPVTSAEWTAKAQIRNGGGDPALITAASTGTRDGDLTLDADGTLSLSLPAAFTVTLPTTAPQGGYFAGDVAITRTGSNPVERHVVMFLRARVYPGVTT